MKTMYEINWHYKDSEQTQFSHYTVTPITILREGILPGCTAVSITAKDTNGRTFQGSPRDYFETEAQAWAHAKQDLIDTIQHNVFFDQISHELLHLVRRGLLRQQDGRHLEVDLTSHQEDQP